MPADLTSLISRRQQLGRTFDDSLLGQVFRFADEYKNSGDRIWQAKSGGLVICRLVKNSSGGTLTPGKAVKFSASAPLKEISGYAGAGEVVDGFVDPYTAKTPVANGQHFLIVVGGRLLKAKSASETYTVGALVKSGASGVVTASAALTTAGFCGVVAAATTSAGADVEIIVTLRESINNGTF